MPSVEFFFNPSKKLLFLLVSIYTSCIIILFCLPLYFLVKLLVLFLIIYQGRSDLMLHVYRKPKDAVICLWKNGKGHWGYQTRAGLRVQGKIRGESYTSTHFMIIRLKCYSHIKNVVIFNDALNSAEYRALSAQLKFSSYIAVD